MIATALLLFILVLTLFGALLGLARGRKKAIARAVTILAAFLIALILTGPVLGSVTPEKIAEVAGELPTELVDVLTVAPSLFAFAIGLVKPMIFLVIFFALTVVLWFVYFIVSLFLRYKKKEKRRRKMGALIGALQGLLVAVLLLTPILGYATMADEALGAYVEMADPADTADIVELREEFLTPITGNGLLSATATVTKPLFSSLSSAKTDTAKISVSKEIPLLLMAMDDVTLITEKIDNLSGFGPEEKAALRGISDSFAESDFLPTVTAEILSGITSRWAGGETFMDIEKPEVEGEFGGIVDTLLDLFADSTAETVERDFDTIVEFLILLVDYDVIDAMNGDEDIFESLTRVNPETDKTFIKAAVALLDTNPHLSPLRSEIMSLGAQTVISQLGTPEEIREKCEPMVDELVTILRDAEGDTNEEKIESLTPVIKKELANNEIDEIPEEIVDEASRFLLDKLEEDNVSLEDITEEDVFRILDELAAEGEIPELGA